MKKSVFDFRFIKLTLRNLLIVAGSLFLALCVIEFALQAVTADTPESDNDNAVAMSYEKSPVSSLLTTEENLIYVQEKYFLNDPEGYEKFLAEAEPGVAAYPLIANLPTTAAYDENTANIVVFGDSFAWGEASLNRNELFWRQMEQILRQKGYNVRVYAVAEEGASAYEELHWLESGVLEDLDPDLVLFGYVFNDALRPGNGFGRMPAQMAIPQLPWLNAFPMVSQKVYAYIDAKTIYSQKFGDRYKDSWISVLDDEIFPYYKTNFADRLDAFSKKNDLPAVVVTLPNETNSLLLEELYKPLPEAFRDTSIAYYNSYYDFKKNWSGKKHKANIHVNAMNVHPGSAAHRFYAEYICDFLIRDFADVLGEPAGSDLNSRVIALNDQMPGKIDFELLYRGEEACACTFTYPDITKPHTIYGLTIDPYCLTAPIGKDYVKLSFETPVDLSEVVIEGEGAGQTELYYTKVNPDLRYDDHTVYPCTTSGQPGLWLFAGEKQITSLCIHAPGPGRLNVTIKGKAAN